MQAAGTMHSFYSEIFDKVYNYIFVAVYGKESKDMLFQSFVSTVFCRSISQLSGRRLYVIACQFSVMRLFIFAQAKRKAFWQDMPYLNIVLQDALQVNYPQLMGR